MKIESNILSTIGRTPMVWLNNLNKRYGVKVAGKVESFNPGSSVKDRIAFSMIESAEKVGVLKTGMRIVEPTSGNTGIGLAMVAAVKGYRLTLVMPESVSSERVSILKYLGAEVILTPAEGGMKGAVDEAVRISEENNDVYIPFQFKNPANPEIHRKTTAEEIWNDTEGKIDIFVAGVGTGGTITGVGEFLKEKNNKIRVVAVEPLNSPVLSGGTPSSHKIQGIGAGFVPDILNLDIIDEVIKVSDDDAMNMARFLAKEEGILCGISSGAAVHAAKEVGMINENKEKLIVVVLPDTAERYISTELFE